MTIKEYLNRELKKTTIDEFLKYINEINEDIELDDTKLLQELKTQNQELIEEFGKLTNNADKISRVHNSIVQEVLDAIEEVDCNFLKRKLPPHMLKK